ncbi:hypothetical protein APA_3062 [Pseudanabaena sp. lw0831]|nr:hypothetical protein APA_3062 [Pseudanabaena sp. lw0831]
MDKGKQTKKANNRLKYNGDFMLLVLMFTIFTTDFIFAY